MESYDLREPGYMPADPQNDSIETRIYWSLMINEELGPPGLAVTV